LTDFLECYCMRYSTERIMKTEKECAFLHFNLHSHIYINKLICVQMYPIAIQIYGKHEAHFYMAQRQR